MMSSLTAYVLALKIKNADASFPSSQRTIISHFHYAGAVPVTNPLHATVVHCFRKVHELSAKRLKKHEQRLAGAQSKEKSIASISGFSVVQLAAALPLGLGKIYDVSSLTSSLLVSLLADPPTHSLDPAGLIEQPGLGGRETDVEGFVIPQLKPDPILTQMWKSLDLSGCLTTSSFKLRFQPPPQLQSSQ